MAAGAVGVATGTADVMDGTACEAFVALRQAHNNAPAARIASRQRNPALEPGLRVRQAGGLPDIA
jgi:hypothetical protein